MLQYLFYRNTYFIEIQKDQKPKISMQKFRLGKIG